ncbi:MAG: hypothetical protein [Circular genetic element sp.]|nr:MAG: hypothetical protein [Circular genetic element sp.]
MGEKSLGQIHTVDFNLEIGVAAPTGTGNAFLCDLSQSLSEQLQRNVRQGQYYKLVGVDAVIQAPEFPLLDATSGVVKGRFRYFLPTRGRCEAYRLAFKQMMEQMKGRGISPGMNSQYDFRTLPRGLSNYDLNAFLGHDLKNLATLDGQTVLALTDNTMTGTEVFDSYNENIQDKNLGTPDFPSGLRTQISTLVTPTDFVLNEGNIYSGNEMIADTELEEIPFSMAFSYEAGNFNSQQLNWRPDPALYIAIMCGQVEIVIDEMSADGAQGLDSDGIELDFSFHIAGWKSIMGNPDSKKSRSRSSRK